MVQHLLNTTAIWLLSLLLFDVFLRKESYHNYNRLFLLITFLAGIFLPSWHWQGSTMIEATGMYRPVQVTATATRAIVETTATPAAFNWQDWALLIYLSGIAVGFVLLAREAVIIRRLYNNGIKSKDGVWTIVETGKAHSPFSAFRCVYISNKQDYTPAQLRMILLHEEQHGHALHFIDLLIVQLAKVILWFHPLVYIYHNRLLMVHEYQADAAVEQNADEYGRFLIEQAILGAAPALSHSFNRSPVKQRIKMLRHTASAFAKTKKLVAIPLVLACILFFTQKSFSEDNRKEGGKLYYNGNVFELWAPPNGDTVMVEDPVSGDMILKITRPDSLPVKMNGKSIYKEEELTKDEAKAAIHNRAAVIKYVYAKITPDLEKLDDGTYMIFINQVIIDTKGKIVYNSEPQVRDTSDFKKTFPGLGKKITTALNDAHNFKPVLRGDVPVIFMMQEDMFTRHPRITVRNHKVTF